METEISETRAATVVVLGSFLDAAPLQPFSKIAANIAEHTIMRRDIISPVGSDAKSRSSFVFVKRTRTRAPHSVIGWSAVFPAPHQCCGKEYRKSPVRRGRIGTGAEFVI